MRMRFVIAVNPSKLQAAHLPFDADATFVPMDAISDGLGGLDVGISRPIAELTEGSYRFFAEGDLLLAKVTPCFENGKKAIARGLVNGIGFATSEVVVIRPNVRRLDTNYLRYLLSSEPFRAAAMASMTGAGGLKRISDRAIRDFPLLVEDPGAQKAIAIFLDHETGRIDQLIDAKERLLEALDAKWSAALDLEILGQDRGGSRATPLRHPYIGSVPADWSLTPLKHLVNPLRPILYGIVLPGPNVDDGVLIVKGGDVKPDRLSATSLAKTTFEIEAGYARSRLKGGDLVIAIRGGIGDIEIVPDAISGANLTQDAARIAPRRGLSHEWLRYCLKSPAVFAVLAAGATGAAVRGINIFDLKSVPIPVPSPAEQTCIAARLQVQEAQIARLRALITNHLALIRERRAALITAAVTGHIDVRAQPITIATKPDRARFRIIVGAEIVQRHQGTPKFGRVKLQKTLYLAEAHAGLGELQGNYLREAAGPLDRALIAETERGMAAAGFFQASTSDGETGNGIVYAPLAKAGQHRSELAALLGPRAESLKRLINVLRDLDTRAVEAIATLYAVWNDALTDGEPIDDAAIVKGVLTDWHSEKGEKFKKADLHTWLAWMRRHGLVPRGEGPQTSHTITRDMFA